jgi:hypothetical protein
MMARGEKLELWKVPSFSPEAAVEGLTPGTKSLRLDAERARTVVVLFADEAGVKLRLDLQAAAPGTGQSLADSFVEIPLDGLQKPGEGAISELKGTLKAAASCNCVSACEDGYLPDPDDNTYCLKACPSGFTDPATGKRTDAEFLEAGAQCLGAYTTPKYWTEKACLNDNNLDIGCEQNPWIFGLVVPKCKPGFNRVSGVFAQAEGDCVPDCAAFGLDQAEFFDAMPACRRPKKERTNVSASGGSCSEGFDISGNCPRAEVAYTVFRLN